MSLIVWDVVKGMNQVLRKNSRSSFEVIHQLLQAILNAKAIVTLKIMVTIKRLHTDYVSIYQYVS